MNSFAFRRLFVGYSFIIIFQVINADKLSTKNICTPHLTCADCISADANCAWCKQENSEGDQYPRCNFIYNSLDKCDPEHLVQPDNSMIIVRDQEPNRNGFVYDEWLTQLRPQEVNLRLRPGAPYSMRVQFQQLQQFPLDVYYLVDLSLTGLDYDREKQILLGNVLAEKIPQITSNFRIGFGSFVNGLAADQNINDICPECDPPYSFRNRLSLGINAEALKHGLTNLQSSYNSDKANGGLEAIMQAVVCNREIGWRHNSLKIIVVAALTDMQDSTESEIGETLHVNDGQCHMDAYGSYTASSKMTLPSINQLNHKAKEKKISLIFATSATQYYFYEDLIRSLENSASMPLDYTDSIVNEIELKYNQLTANVTLFDNSAGDYTYISYQSKCINSDVTEHTRTCTGLKIGTTVTFDVTVEVTSCPEDPLQWKQMISIFPSGIREELTVNLEMICKCDCDKSENKTNEVCKYVGFLQDQETAVASELLLAETPKPLFTGDESSCLKTNDSLVCSGRGDCVHGKCSCNFLPDKEDLYYGDYCECDNTNCDRYHDKVCNGQGLCICGICMCDPGWTGTACQCNLNNEICIAPGDQRVCSGFGTCECGKCKCHTSPGVEWFGDYCEECSTCPTKCDYHRPCVECKVFKTGPYGELECNHYCTVEPTLVDEVDENTPGRLCTYNDEEECKLSFTYGYSEGKQFIRVQRLKECPGY